MAFHRSYPLFASSSDDCTAYVFHGMVYSDLNQDPLIVPLEILRGHTTSNGRGENVGFIWLYYLLGDWFRACLIPWILFLFTAFPPSLDYASVCCVNLFITRHLEIYTLVFNIWKKDLCLWMFQKMSYGIVAGLQGYWTANSTQGSPGYLQLVLIKCLNFIAIKKINWKSHERQTCDNI